MRIFALTRRERTALTLTGTTIALCALVFMVGTPTPSRSDEPFVVQSGATDSPQSDDQVVADLLRTPRLTGEILSPFGMVSASPPPANGPAAALPAQPRPMGFNFNQVPGMTVGMPFGDQQTVYALGAHAAILQPGGPLIRPGSMVNGQRVVKIARDGVHLANGAIITPLQPFPSAPAAMIQPTPAASAVPASSSADSGQNQPSPFGGNS